MSSDTDTPRPGWAVVGKDDLVYAAEHRVAEPAAVAATATPRRHVVIAGYGRAGTSFLVQLLTALGLDTGFAADDLKLFEKARAGLEHDLGDANAPYVVKSPGLTGAHLDALLAAGTVALDLAILPMRDLAAAAKSRAHVQETVTGSREAVDDAPLVPGGLWREANEDDQAQGLALRLVALVETLARYDIPVVFAWYPRLVLDADYLFRKLSPLLGGIDSAQFQAVHRATVRPDWVNSFTPGDR